MTSERAETPAAPEQQHHGIPGKALAAQREAMGWTVEQVADQLKLAVRQVIALEAGDYAALPSPAVTRGFVRAYAKILKLDAAPLVAMIEMDTPEPVNTGATAVRRDPKPTAFSEVRFSPGGKRPSLPLGWIAGGVVVVAVAAAAWHFGVVGSSQRHEVAANGASATAELPATGTASAPGAAPASAPETLQSTSVPLISVPSASSPAPAANETAPAGTNAAPANANAAPANAGAVAAPGAAGANAPAAQAATPGPVVTGTAGPAPAAAPAAAAPAGSGELVFKVREDSWISVSPAKGGKPIVSQLFKAGSTETVNVTEPVKVVVGNAPGVSATLRGAPVELPGKTARISLK